MSDNYKFSINLETDEPEITFTKGDASITLTLAEVTCPLTAISTVFQPLVDKTKELIAIRAKKRAETKPETETPEAEKPTKPNWWNKKR